MVKKDPKKLKKRPKEIKRYREGVIWHVGIQVKG
jgi:hypothetical protein